MSESMFISLADARLPQKQDILQYSCAVNSHSIGTMRFLCSRYYYFFILIYMHDSAQYTDEMKHTIMSKTSVDVAKLENSQITRCSTGEVYHNSTLWFCAADGWLMFVL